MGVLKLNLATRLSTRALFVVGGPVVQCPRRYVAIAYLGCGGRVLASFANAASIFARSSGGQSLRRSVIGWCLVVGWVHVMGVQLAQMRR